jgi:hypothetical protein
MSCQCAGGGEAHIALSAWVGTVSTMNSHVNRPFAGPRKSLPTLSAWEWADSGVGALVFCEFAWRSAYFATNATHVEGHFDGV